MAHKKKHTPPVPPKNRPKAGPPAGAVEEQSQAPVEGAPFQDQDPKHRLGNYGGAGEHPLQQPGGRNDAIHNR